MVEPSGVQSRFLPSFAFVLFLPGLTMSLPLTPSSPSSSIAPLHLPPISEETLPNGLTVITARKAELPLVAVRLVMRTGASLDPKGKEGIAAFTGMLLRRGTTKRSANQIDDEIESIGGLMGVDVGYEGTSIVVTVPSENVATAVDVLADLAQRPAFREKEFDLAKRRELAHLKQDLDDPSGLADRALVRYYYGKDHPFGHPTEGRTASVKTFKRSDVVSFHKKTYGAAGAMLFFVGDIDPATAQTLASKAFAKWAPNDRPSLEIPVPEKPDGLQIVLVDKADATQAQIRVVSPGLARKDPEYYAAVVANTIVGGGFTSRLVDEVRVNRGLSYSVSTRLVSLRKMGAISYSTFTRTETVREILDVSFKVLNDFREKGPTAEETEKAKRYVIGLYPGRVESIDQLAEALAGAKMTDLPFESIAEYRSRVGAVDPAAASQVAKRFPTPAGARVVIVGNAKKIRPQLEGLGTLKVIKVKELE
jgi:zinc protease